VWPFLLFDNNSSLDVANQQVLVYIHVYMYIYTCYFKLLVNSSMQLDSDVSNLS